MAPTYKLRYFDFTGRAEPIRMLFSYGKIPFVDERIGRDDWAKIKPTTPLGQLPILEIDGKVIPHSIPICRHVAALVNLDGKDSKENLLIDITVETLSDLQKVINESRFERDEEKKKEKEKKAQEILPIFLGKLEEFAKKNGGYTSLNRLTWADIIFICTYEHLINTLPTDPFTAYPSLLQVKKNVLSVPSIKDWIKNRPAIPAMGPFTNKYDLKQDI